MEYVRVRVVKLKKKKIFGVKNTWYHQKIILTLHIPNFNCVSDKY